MKEDIRASYPRPKSVKKWVLVAIGIMIVLFIGVIFVEAFKPADQIKQQKTQPIKKDISPVSTDLTKPFTQDLPGSYQDVEKIKPYLSQNSKTLQLQKEIEALKIQQSSLLNKLNSLKQTATRAPTTQPSDTDVRTEQAMTSGLFFPGSSPIDEKTIVQNKISLKKLLQTETKTETPASTEQQQTGTPTSATLSGNIPQASGTPGREQQRISFLSPSSQKEDIYNPHRLTTPISPYEVQAGTIIPAVLVTAINTSLPGQVVAQVREDIYDSVHGNYLLVPKGSKLLGAYDSQVVYGDSRVLIAFTRIIRPDGSSILLEKYSGTDIAGQAGIEGNVNNHWGKIIGASTLSTLLSIGAGAASDNVNRGTYYPTASQNALMAAGTSISQTGQNLVDRSINVKPTLTLPAGFRFDVIVRKDLVMMPYTN